MSEPYRQIPYDVYRQEWLKVHEAIFSGRPPNDKPFRDPNWEGILLPHGFNMDDDVFDALSAAGRAEGDLDIMITDAEVIPVDMWAVGLSWSREALDEIGSGARYGFVTAHLFGRSGSWGVARDDEDDFLCVGGTGKFMGTLVAALGGRSVVRDRFLRYAVEDLQAPVEYRDKLLDSVGWRISR